MSVAYFCLPVKAEVEVGAGRTAVGAVVLPDRGLLSRWR